MKNLIKLVNGAQKAIGFGVAGAVFCGTMGCATMTPAQKTALWGQSLSILSEINAPGPKSKGVIMLNDAMRISGNVLTNQAMMQHDLEIANAGKSEIIINNNPPNNQSQNYNQNQSQNYNNLNNLEPPPEGLFMYKKFIDFDNKGPDRKDYLNLNESIYDLRNLDSLCFSFNENDKIYGGQSLDFKIYSMEDGKTINYFNRIYDLQTIQDFVCESNYFPKSGKYKAVLNTGNGKSFSLDFDIIK